MQWLNLSINKNVPISLLILSRAFTLDSKVRQCPASHTIASTWSIYQVSSQALSLTVDRRCPLMMQFTDPAAAVADSISSLDKDVVNEVRAARPSSPAPLESGFEPDFLVHTLPGFGAGAAGRGLWS